MKKLNKAMSVAVAAAMMVSLGACGNSADAAKDGTQSAGASGKVYNIGICQQLEHPALDQATQGFEDVLKEKLGDNVKFDLQNAQNEQANASTIANNFVSSNVDLILANATTALQACAQPIFRFWELPLRIMQRHWRLMTGVVQPEEISPVHPIWLRLISRRICS